MRRTAMLAATVGIAATYWGCAVKPPEVRIVGEKTALEKQILGTYAQIEEDVWMVASVRSSQGGEGVVLSEEKKRVLEAMQNRAFNKDDVEEFKKDGCVGENREGLLEVRPCAKRGEDQEYQALVEQIVQEDNRDRKIIMKRVINVNADIEREAEEEVAAVFAKMNRDSAKPGDWIQLPDGKWLKKK